MSKKSILFVLQRVIIMYNLIIKTILWNIFMENNILDNLEKIKQIDTSDMAGYILEMPNQIKQSLNKINELKISEEFINFKPDNICLCGMGGSALANHLIANLPQKDKPLVMQVVRGYEIPSWVNEKTLVIVTSHSGTTAETLSAFKQAVKKNAKIFIVAERGDIEKLGQESGAIVFDYDTKAVPRASLGYQLGAIFGFLNRMKIINYDLKPALEKIEELNSKLKPKIEVENNFAKHLAFSYFDRLPIIVASGILQSVAWRWKTQLNENANHFAFTEFLPEAMHNALQGLDNPARFKDELIYIFLENKFDSPELKDQFEKMKKILDENNIRFEIVEAEGNDVFSQKLSTLIIGDWVSYYVSILYETDPTPVDTIESAKKMNIG